jgi:hypothetical protein
MNLKDNTNVTLKFGHQHLACTQRGRRVGSSGRTYKNQNFTEYAGNFTQTFNQADCYTYSLSYAELPVQPTTSCYIPGNGRVLLFCAC